MKLNVALAIILAAITIAKARSEGGPQSLDLIRVLNENTPWFDLMLQEQWERQQADTELEPDTDSDDTEVNEDTAEGLSTSYDNGEIVDTDKRSAVASALNAGRRRRRPEPALGLLNNMDSFFDKLRENVEVLTLLSPHQRSSLFQKPPQVIQVPSAGVSGGGVGMRRLHALRPLRPGNNIRSYNRRSFEEPDRRYPMANNHDPGLLWTGLGRR